MGDKVDEHYELFMAAEEEALDGSEVPADGLKVARGIWVMRDKTAAVSAGISGAYAHVLIGGTHADRLEAAKLLKDLGYVPAAKSGAHVSEDGNVLSFPYV